MSHRINQSALARPAVHSSVNQRSRRTDERVRGTSLNRSKRRRLSLVFVVSSILLLFTDGERVRSY